tara:strand:+ start:408 stop:1085 length:678 start_codon:yes stop_codon:yes gene_type:complete
MFEYIKSTNDYLSTRVPPLYPNIPFNWVINFQKGFTSIYVITLMYYFQNFTLTPYIYLSLHGVYGILWLIKDHTFPDINYRKNITLPSAGLTILTVLGPYWISPYLIIKNFIQASPLKICFCISLHTFGCVTMMAADTQKYFVLKETKRLIKDGWFQKSRNINYFGEMMIYFSYACLGESWVPYFILFYIWTFLFLPNMLYKDSRMINKPGGKEYYKHSNLLFPF